MDDRRNAMRTWLMVPVTAALVACGGSGGGGSGSPADLAATACDEEMTRRMEGKLYELDKVALAASMKDAPDATKILTAPVVVEPGLTSEVKQIVECRVRFAEGKPAPDIVGFGFNW
jgi:hypothetical protein